MVIQEIWAVSLETKLCWRCIIIICHYLGFLVAAKIVEHDFNNPGRQESFFFCHLTTWPHSLIPLSKKGGLISSGVSADLVVSSPLCLQRCPAKPDTFQGNGREWGGDISVVQGAQQHPEEEDAGGRASPGAFALSKETIPAAAA